MWQTAFLPGSMPDGTPILSLLAKGTYAIAQGSCIECEEQVPLVTEDRYADPSNPLYSEVIAETDLIFYKPSTDVVILGKAHAPRGKKAYHLDCDVVVGPLRKTVRVFGKRRAKIKAFGGVSITDPEPFEEIELGYTKAYGGTCKDKNGTIVTFFPNPIGSGFTVKGGIDDDIESLPVPNIEDPLSPVTADNLVVQKFEDWPSAPKPASLGWTRRNFYPRYTWAGVLPEFLEAAQKNRDEMAKKYPELANTPIPKMDFRVFQGASDGLWGKTLSGREHVVLSYLDAAVPRFEFELPGAKPRLIFDIGEGPKELEPVLQTVVIDKEKNICTMLWRGSLEYAGIEQLATLPKLEYAAVD